LLGSAMRAFLAVEMSPDVRERLVDVKRELAQLGAAVRWVRDDNLHVTVKFLGSVAEDALDELRALLLDALRDTAPMAARVRGLGAFPDLRRARVVWAGVECAPLPALAARLDAAAARIGVAPETRPFRAHLTLGRVNGTRGWKPLAEFWRRARARTSAPARSPSCSPSAATCARAARCIRICGRSHSEGRAVTSMRGRLAQPAAARVSEWDETSGGPAVVGVGRGGTTMAIDSNRERALDLAVSAIEKQFGKGAIMKLGDNVAVPDVPVISTGSLGLDIALGVGGLPRGRVVEIYGPESSGKTTLALQVIACAQRDGGTCAFVDAEHALDITYARKLGVPDRGSAHRPARQRRAGAGDRRNAGAERRHRRAGRRLGRRPGAARRDRGRDGRAADGPAGPPDVAGAPQAHRHHLALADDHGLHQPDRMKIGVMFGNPETTTGGNALKFYASVRLDIRRVDRSRRTRPSSAAGPASG
jgi:2'-5' RNA ligase